LLAAGVIRWHIPVAVLAGIVLPALVGHAVNPERYLSAPQHLLSGAAILGAFFIATDYVTSPNTPTGQLVFGFGVGLMTWIIRSWGGFPEGMAFAVLLMNALTPVIDRACRPRILGRRRDGRPLEPEAIDTRGSA
jgi:Na+-translocating ferredoxin:NAD+ oxidoreductase RnfD subunit